MSDWKVNITRGDEFWTEYWEEFKLIDFLSENPPDYAVTKFGDQEIVWIDKNRKHKPVEEVQIYINGPGPSCGCRQIKFPKVKPVVDTIDYTIEKDNDTTN